MAEPKRYRTFFKGLFIPNGVIHAKDRDAALAEARKLIEVRQDLAR